MRIEGRVRVGRLSEKRLVYYHCPICQRMRTPRFVEVDRSSVCRESRCRQPWRCRSDEKCLCVQNKRIEHPCFLQRHYLFCWARVSTFFYCSINKLPLLAWTLDVEYWRQLDVLDADDEWQNRSGINIEGLYGTVFGSCNVGHSLCWRCGTLSVLVDMLDVLNTRSIEPFKILTNSCMKTIFRQSCLLSATSRYDITPL